MHRLRLSMINRHTRFEVSTITCNEEIKSKKKYVKILILSHNLVDLGVTHRIRLWLDEKRIVNFLLVIIELFR